MLFISTFRLLTRALAVPIEDNGRIIGVINIESKEQILYEQDEKLLGIIAMHAASALHRIRELENEKIFMSGPDFQIPTQHDRI